MGATRRRTFVKGVLKSAVVAAAAGPSVRGAAQAPAVARSVWDTAVIGAGVFGAWTALQLRRAGQRVLLLDAYGPGNSRSSSGDESRIIRISYGTQELYSRWSLRSLELWRELFDAARQPWLFQRTGVLRLAGAKDTQAEDSVVTLRRLGVYHERLSVDELRSRYPQIGLDGIHWGLLEPESGVLLARRAVQATTAELTRLGGEVRVARAAARKGPGRSASVTTGAGEAVNAGQFVFACGAWLPKLFPEHLTDVIKSIRAEVHYVGSAPGDRRFSPPDMPAWIDNPLDAYGVPDIESRGLKVGVDPEAPPSDPDTADRRPSVKWSEAVEKYVAVRFPGLRGGPTVEARVCQYENTVNHELLIDRHPDFANVWFAGGGSGHGFKLGPAVGDYVAARVMKGDAPEARFTLEDKHQATKRTVK